jgi:hypothetical protein
MGQAEGYWRNDLDGSTRLSPPSKGTMISIFRRYPHEWQVAIFRPIGRLESWVRGIEVHIGHDALYPRALPHFGRHPDNRE